MLKVLTAAAVALVLSNATAHSTDLKYHAIWHSGAQKMYLTNPLERDDFRARTAQYTAAGRRLVDIETTVIGDRRCYVGVWTDAPDVAPAQNLVQGPLPIEVLQDRLTDLADRGLRLTDIELISDTDNMSQILGVWQAGDGDQLIHTGLTLDRLRARDRALRQQGMYLADVEATVKLGQIRYTALWRTGDVVQVITMPRDLPGFQRLTYVMERRGFHVSDLIAVSHEGRVKLGGVWARQPQASLVVSRNDTTEGFTARGWHESLAGRRLVDVELTPGPFGQYPDTVVGGRMDAMSLTHF